MITRLERLIEELILRKQGNKEFALFHVPSEKCVDMRDQWQAHVGCPTPHAGLGEVVGEIVGRGVTPTEAVWDALMKVSYGR